MFLFNRSLLAGERAARPFLANFCTALDFFATFFVKKKSRTMSAEYECYSFRTLMGIAHRTRTEHITREILQPKA